MRQFAAAFVTIELLLISAFLAPGVFQGRLSLTPSMLFIAIGAMIAVTMVSTWIFGARLERQREMWRSYRVEIDAARLVVARGKGAPTVIRRADVTHIVEHAGAGLSVVAGNSRVTVVVPMQIRGYDELRARLGAWATIEEVPRRATRGGLLLLVVGLIAAFIGTFTFANIHVATLAGLGVIGLGAMAIARVNLAYEVGTGTRVLALGTLGLLMLAPFVRLAIFFTSLPG